MNRLLRQKITLLEIGRLLPWWRQPEHPINAGLMRLATRLGDGWLWLLLAPILLLQTGLHRGIHLLGRTMVVAALSILLYKLLKRAFNRPRPCERDLELEPLLGAPDRFSFPSGHTMNNVAVALYLGHHEPWLVPWLLPLSVVIGYSRLYLRVHYPTDVLMGFFLGILIGLWAPLLPWLDGRGI